MAHCTWRWTCTSGTFKRTLSFFTSARMPFHVPQPGNGDTGRLRLGEPPSLRELRAARPGPCQHLSRGWCLTQCHLCGSSPKHPIPVAILYSFATPQQSLWVDFQTMTRIHHTLSFRAFPRQVESAAALPRIRETLQLASRLLPCRRSLLKPGWLLTVSLWSNLTFFS